MFRGAYTALITPFRNGTLDAPALGSLVNHQIAQGIHGLVPCGTTGESPTLTHREHIEVVRQVVKAADGRVPVIAGAGSNNTAEAIELSQGAKAEGAQATLQITPYYNKPTQEGLYRHFMSIAEAVDLPVILYNVPGRTSIDLEADTVRRLAEHPNIVGVKEATGDMTRAARIKELCGENFVLLSGDDFTLYPLLALGGDGVISVTSNIVPAIIADMCRAIDAGDYPTARDLHFQQLPLCRALFCQANPIPVKAAMARLGYCTPEIRSPLTEVAPGSDAERTLLACLQSMGLQKRG